MHWPLSEGWTIVTVMCTAALGIAALLIGLSWLIESNECSVAQHQYGKATTFDYFGGGCYIKTGGANVLLNNYTNFKAVK